MRAARLVRTVTLGAFAALTAHPALAFPDHVFVVTGDTFSPGNCSSLAIDPPWTPATGLEPVGNVPAVRHFLGLHWVVDRSPGGEIQVIDPATFDTVVRFGVGGMPHDVLVVDAGHAWVTRHDSPWLLEIDPADGAPLDSLDLGLFADADGIPEMATMERDGDRLFVQIQRRNSVSQPPFLPGLLAVVDLATKTIVDTDPVTPGVQAIALQGYWPDLPMQVDGAARKLYVCTPGPTLDTSGGIEEIDLDSLTRDRFLVAEADLPADLGPFVLVSSTRGYFIAHTEIIPSSHLTLFSRPDGTPLGEVHAGLGFFIDSVAFDPVSGQLFFPDPIAAGIHVLDAATGTHLTTTPIPTGQAPIDLLVARDAAVSAGIGPGAPSGRLSRAAPNPAPGATAILLARPAARAHLTILDVRGTIVRTLDGPPLRWDGRDDRGARATAGVYFYRLEGDVTDAGRFVLLR